MTSHRRAIAWAGLALVLAGDGCATSLATPPPFATAAAPPTWTEPTDEVLGPGDVLVISVRHLVRVGETHTMELTVGAQATIPGLGTLTISGPTTAGVREDLARRLREGEILLDPNVTVLVLERRAPRVTILGAVGVPGRTVLPSDRVPLKQALDLVGGLRPDAADLGLLRTAGGAREIDLLRRGQELVAGDLLHVPTAMRYTVTGHVARPGEYLLRRRTTVLQAVALAGGVRQDGALDRARLRRRTPVGETIEVDLERIVTHERPDVELLAGDVIEVPPDGWRWLTGLLASTLRLLDGRSEP